MVEFYCTVLNEYWIPPMHFLVKMISASLRCCTSTDSSSGTAVARDLYDDSSPGCEHDLLLRLVVLAAVIVGRVGV